MKKQIAIIGLGLIGGSISRALRGFEKYTVVGVDVDEQTLKYAKENGVADIITSDAIKALASADVVFICLHPQAIVDFMSSHREDFQHGALVTDVCGIKTAILEAAAVLPTTVDFIGCHPMAGKETSGVFNAEATLFKNAHFIITPRPESTLEHIELMGRMAAYMGFRDVVNTTSQHHDAIIAYTSQVMHVLAVAVCDDPDLFECRGFEGGSFRDCTRVAALDVPLWTELFSMNSNALCGIIRQLEDNLRLYRETIESGDRAALAEKLLYSSDRKRRMNLE